MYQTTTESDTNLTLGQLNPVFSVLLLLAWLGEEPTMSGPKANDKRPSPKTKNALPNPNHKSQKHFYTVSVAFRPDTVTCR